LKAENFTEGMQENMHGVASETFWEGVRPGVPGHVSKDACLRVKCMFCQPEITEIRKKKPTRTRKF
jgi:hypothetical protein